jgi:hypothetical protein
MKIRFCLLAALSLAVSACGAVSSRDLALPATPLLSGGLGWAIVNASYVRLKEKPDAGASDLAALRDGTEAEVIGREYDAQASSLWYHVRVADETPQPSASASKGASKDAHYLEGWVSEAELSLYATKTEADRALREKKAP